MRPPGLRLGHVNIEVHDLRRCQKFHDRFLPVLGFRPLPVTDAAWLGYRRGRMTLWFTVSRPPRSRLGSPHVPTTGATDPISSHLGFFVPQTSELLTIARTLRRRGFTPIYEVDWTATAGSTWYVSAAWADADLNVFEIYTVTRRAER